jgi:hypothetical protein
VKKSVVISGLLLIIVILAGLLLIIPNSLGEEFLNQARIRGYLPYTPEAATTLAYDRCTTCHEAEKIVKYCPRCGPPFIVSIRFMKKYVELSNIQGKKIRPFSDAELVTITQVWNGLVGNWESDWPRTDIRKLLGNDRALLDLFETPVEERAIEVVLQDKVAPGSYKEITQKSKPTNL